MIYEYNKYMKTTHYIFKEYLFISTELPQIQGAQ